MNKKKYEWGVICGRFQSFHKGHEKVIEKGIELCDNLLILIGSSQVSGTERNPFNITTRFNMLFKSYIDYPNVYIGVISDLSTEDDISPEWGEYFLNRVRYYIGRKPDVIIFGNDEERSKWFSDEQKQGIEEIVIKREELPISATLMREYIVENNKEEWMKYTNPNIHKMWDSLREELKSVPAYQDKNWR